MRKFIAVALIAYFVFYSCSGKVAEQHLSGDYFGLEKPGETPAVFAPGIISTGFHDDGGPAFMPDMNEIYFRVAQYPHSVIFYMRKNSGGIWSEPQTAPFSGKYSDGAPVISPDGGKLFFSSNRPVDGIGEAMDNEDIWYIVRRGREWSEPIHLGNRINTVKSEWKPSVSENSTLYFTSNINGNGPGIFYSEFNAGRYGIPVSFDRGINERYNPYSPCIAPDESYMIFGSSINSRYRSDLFITFRDEYGKWSEPVNLGRDINSDRDDLFPQLSPDGKFLFFTSWRYIYPLQTENGRSYREMLDIYTSPGNGRGADIYWVSTSIFDNLRTGNGR